MQILSLFLLVTVCGHFSIMTMEAPWLPADSLIIKSQMQDSNLFDCSHYPFTKVFIDKHTNNEMLASFDVPQALSLFYYSPYPQCSTSASTQSREFLFKPNPHYQKYRDAYQKEFVSKPFTNANSLCVDEKYFVKRVFSRLSKRGAQNHPLCQLMEYADSNLDTLLNSQLVIAYVNHIDSQDRFLFSNNFSQHMHSLLKKSRLIDPQNHITYKTTDLKELDVLLNSKTVIEHACSSACAKNDLSSFAQGIEQNYEWNTVNDAKIILCLKRIASKGITNKCINKDCDRLYTNPYLSDQLKNNFWLKYEILGRLIHFSYNFITPQQIAKAAQQRFIDSQNSIKQSSLQLLSQPSDTKNQSLSVKQPNTPYIFSHCLSAQAQPFVPQIHTKKASKENQKPVVTKVENKKDNYTPVQFRRKKNKNRGLRGARPPLNRNQHS